MTLNRVQLDFRPITNTYLYILVRGGTSVTHLSAASLHLCCVYASLYILVPVCVVCTAKMAH